MRYLVSGSVSESSANIGAVIGGSVASLLVVAVGIFVGVRIIRLVFTKLYKKLLQLS